MDDPELTGSPIRMVEGSGSTDVVLPGENLIQSSRVYGVSGENASPDDKASRTYLYSRTLDLRHVDVTIPSDLIDKPGTLTAYAKDSWPGLPGDKIYGAGQKIIVVSRDSPVISSVEPGLLRSRGRDATVTLRGSGFTKDSEVEFGDQLGAGAEVTFVSSTEVKVRIPATELEDSSELHARATPVVLSVLNDPLHFSAPVRIRVVPFAEFKEEPLTASIRAIDTSDGFSKPAVSCLGNLEELHCPLIRCPTR
jgi:hypothetical protein